MSRARTSRSNIAGRRTNIDRLPGLAADLVRRQVAVIATPAAVPRRSRPRRRPRRSRSSSLSAKTRSELGLVASLARPGGNLTGINFFIVELAAKRLELLRELVPAADRVAVLVNPTNPTTAEITLRDVEGGCSRHRAANPGSQRQHQPRDRCGLRDPCARADRCVFVGRPVLQARRVQLVALGVRAMRSLRHIRFVPMPKPAGLMSYGASLTDAYRQVGVYAGRILKGAKPADLPVRAVDQVRAGHQRARPPGCSASTVPPTLLARADEVIE